MTESESTYEDSILELLASKPGLKAKAIAERLGKERSDINSRLYSDLAPYVVQDNNYKWYLLEDAPGRSDGTDLTKSKTTLGRLCRYYLECLTHDDSSGVSVFAEDKYDNPDYTPLEEWPVGRDHPAAIFGGEGARRILAKVRRDSYEKTLFLGFPIFLRHHRAKSGWEGYFVEPLFLFSFDLDTEHRNAPPMLEDRLPWFNLKALENLPSEAGESALYESIQLTNQLGLDRPDLDLAEFDEVALRLKSLRPEWRWQEDPDPRNLSTDPPIKELDDVGIYNRAVLVAGDRSPYTRGLETELNKLVEVDEEQYSGTALGDWLEGASLDSGPPEQRPLLEVLPLNSEQREAVLRSLSNDLTVVTGPPGTGKSQVVTSLLINAAWQGQRVLFASKNNKAVDVVEERVNSLGSRPVLLRTGNNQYQAQLAEYLSKLLSGTADQSDRDRYKRARDKLEEVHGQFEQVEDKIQQVLDLRNDVDDLDREVEELRDALGHEGFGRLRDFDFVKLQQVVKDTTHTVQRAERSRQTLWRRLVWPILRRNRFDEVQRLRARYGGTYELLNLEPPAEDPDDERIHEWVSFVESLQNRAAQARQVSNYFDKLEDVRRARSLEDLQAEEYELIEDLSEVSERVWKRWLDLQPSRLSQRQRKVLGDYTTLLKMIVSAQEDGSSVESKVFRRYYELFPQVASFLSCWAITSLTARRLPFEPRFFDLLVIDEASQCDIASALPLLYRAKRAVIIGDSQQLRHISGVSEKQDRTLLAKHDLIEGNVRWSYSVNSLYDLASHLCTSGDIVNLRDHHRSHADIIEFSNEHFYGGNLRLATQYERLHIPDDDTAVRWKHVSGRVRRPGGGSAVNDDEATAVVEELERIVLDQGYPGTIGVVTPFRAQANRIRDRVHQRDHLMRALSGREFLPNTAHGFQGDERDLMIFSPVVSEGINKGALRFLDSNGHLFNVAITRARGGLVVVGDQEAALESGVSYLSSFAEYVAQLDADGRETKAEGRDRNLGPDYPTVAKPELVSDWEPPVYRALYEAGLRPIPQYNVEKYILDFALFDGQRKLDIEVDGERYHRRWDGELRRRDQLRNFRLIELGWDVMRFWVYQVRDEIDQCVERVVRWTEGGSGLSR